MSIITKVLKSKCVYWAPGAHDAYGQASYEDPVEMSCRWADQVEEVIAPDGTKVASKAVVMVDGDVTVGGVLLYGALEEMELEGSPLANEGAHEILQFAKIPNLKGTEFVRVVML